MIDLDGGLSLCFYFTVCFFIFSVNCGTPPVPSNGIIIMLHTTGTTEGAQAIILCRDIFHSSLLRDNYTVSMCTVTGQWEPDPNDYCAILSATGIMTLYFIMLHFQPLYVNFRKSIGCTKSNCCDSCSSNKFICCTHSRFFWSRNYLWVPLSTM